VVEEQAHLGLAFDGDGDRIIMVDHLGNKIDGDQIAYIIARDALRRGELKGGVVGTLMTNLGMENGLKQLGIPFVRAAVGDRYVMEQLLAKGWKIGAENSGHVILLDKVTTGDAIVAALQVLASVVGSDMTLHDLSQGMTLYPQVLENVRFAGESNPLEAQAVLDSVAAVEAELGDKGRVLLRKSGTEPLIRVMVEGEDAELVQSSALKIADAVKASC
jgi:phosphoglucosamine mutase